MIILVSSSWFLEWLQYVYQRAKVHVKSAIVPLCLEYLNYDISERGNPQAIDGAQLCQNKSVYVCSQAPSTLRGSSHRNQLRNMLNANYTPVGLNFNYEPKRSLKIITRNYHTIAF